MCLKEKLRNLYIILKIQNHIYSNYIYSNYIYSNYIYSNYIYSNYIYSNYIYSNYIYSNQSKTYFFMLDPYKNTIQNLIHTFNLNYNNLLFKYNRQLKYNKMITYSVFYSFINIIKKHGNFATLYNLINIYYKWFTFNYPNVNLYIIFITTIINNLLPINTIQLKKINKKKKKNARLKSKYEQSKSYLITSKRLNFVYKWLNIELLISTHHTFKTRLYSLLTRIAFNQIQYLLIFKLKKNLHKLLLINFLKKKKNVYLIEFINT